MHRMQRIAEDLLGRRLAAQDGVPAEHIAAAERALGRSLPAPLSTFYRLVGNLPQFTTAFEQFAPLAELRDADGLLMFLDEQQGACSWGVDAQGRVFQCHAAHSDRFDEKLDLSDFLELIMYYQVAQGATHAFEVGDPGNELDTLFLTDGWQNVVDHNQLVIRRLHGYLIWNFLDADGQVQNCRIFLSSLIDPPNEMKARYDLIEL